ncbi:LytR C-terminal domain-containing protein [Nocardioides sp. SYSU DS0663]|uniref:LytR C-terminal domain-containing protein n=1 Tax=Nocardioides sp. SYSU DS0663 TaxID=3416445 RepID=UPI003F4B1C17
MRHRDQRGIVFPSPVVMLSIIAVAMAAVAFVATRGGEPTEKEITTISREATPSATPTPSAAPEKKKQKPKPPAIERGKVYVEVYNNSGITGLAGTVADSAGRAGWQVVGSDNWYGTIPATTVYYPARLERAAKLLALDLGIERTAPAVDPMRLDRLTVILTGALD